MRMSKALQMVYENVQEMKGMTDFVGVPDNVLQAAQRKVYKMQRQSGKDYTATDTAKMIDKEINKMGWTMTVGGKYVKENLEEDFTNFSSYAGMYSNGARAYFTDKQGKTRKISASGDNPRKFYIDGKEISREEAKRMVGNQKLKPKQGMNEDLEEAFKPDDIVIPKIGPHKGKKHRIIAVKSDNRYTIAPVDIPARSIQYRLGAATANASDLKKYVKEDLDEEWIDVEEAVNMLEEGKSSTGYDLYHKDFSSAMQHAYEFAKKKYGITIDPEEIDSKVASGPKKPSEGKTNSYSLKGDKGIVQIQVYNKGGSKPYELNMYKS